MPVATERLPLEEMVLRQERVLALCARSAPDAAGLLVFSPLNIYYLTGTLAGGVLWLPREGRAVLLARRALERCRAESPMEHILPFASWGDILPLCAQCGSSPREGGVLAAEQAALPWSLARRLRSRLSGFSFVSGDKALQAARAVKTPWELAKMRLGGQRHHTALRELLPEVLRPGMSERRIAHAAWDVFFSLGHSGPIRTANFGEDCFLGHVCAGENGNYPSHFNGPLGVRGEHPACPFMGDKNSLWQPRSLLALDLGFVLEGYNTDVTQTYWSGPPSSVPDAVRRALDACIDIQARAAEALKSGAVPSKIWEDALARAAVWGVGEGFMGLGGNKVRFLGHGIGLALDEVPVLAPRFDEPLQTGTVMAIEPKVGLPGLGMVGVENTFEVTPGGGRCITGSGFDIICVE